MLRQNTVQILKAYTRKQKTAEVEFPAFAEYAVQYVERYRSQYRQLEAFGSDVRGSLKEALSDLASSGQCRLSVAGDEIQRVAFPLFYAETVREACRQAESAPEAPFPSEADLGITVPNELLTTANVSTDLASLLQGGDTATPLVRLLFPESLRSIVVPSDMIQDRLLDLALAKLKHYLGQADNAAYVQSRLAPAYRGNQALVGEMISNIAMRVANARQTIENASDSHFRFWAQLTHVIVKERRQGTDESSESGCQQAAHIVNAYALALRNAGQNRQNEIRAALKTVETHFGMEPFVYTLRDLLGLKDSSGAPLLKKASRDAFLEFLKDKLRPPTGRVVPELIRLKLADGSEHYVHRDRLIPVFLRMIPAVAEETDRVLAEGWERTLLGGHKAASMSSDAAFAAEVQRVVQTEHPLFHRLFDEGLLNSVQRETKLAPKSALELSRCFDHRGEKLKPFQEILGLERRELLARVRAAVPLWARVAFLRAVVMFFRGLFAGRRRGAEVQPERAAAAPPRPRKRDSAAAAAGATTASTTVKRLEEPSAGGRAGSSPVTSKQRTAAYRRDLERLLDHFAGSGKTLAASLDELAEKWNPLFEPKARADLKEDVDSMTRSFLRGILRHGGSMRPPDAARITSLSQQLVANPAFDRIRRKDFFVRYVELMMIRVLANQHGIKL